LHYYFFGSSGLSEEKTFAGQPFFRLLSLSRKSFLRSHKKEEVNLPKISTLRMIIDQEVSRVKKGQTQLSPKGYYSPQAYHIICLSSTT